MKRIFSFAIYILSIFADLYTIYSGLESTIKNWIAEPPLWIIILAYLLFIISILYVVYYSLHLYLMRKCILSGTHEIPCSLFSYMWAKYINKTRTSLHVMHKIYHESYFTKQKIRDNRDRYNNIEAIKPLVKHFLDTAILAVQRTLHIDTKISVKKITQIQQDYVLQTYIYVTGNLNGHEMRSTERKYIITELNDNMPRTLSTWYDVSKHYATRNGNAQYVSNSIFNYMIGMGVPCWMSNDLKIDEQNKIFHTSSDYRSLYKSLAAFLIMKPKDDENEVSEVEGILTFESDKTNVFVEKECQQIMGFVAHCLYEIFKELGNGQ